MSNVKKEEETILLSIYCDIIMTILKQHEMLSVNKIMVFSYLMKKNSYYYKNVYDGKTTQKTVIKALSLLNGLKTDYYDNIIYILKSIDILVVAEKIDYERNNLIIKDKAYETSYEEGMFFRRAIDASELFTDRQFLKEVMNNV